MGKERIEQEAEEEQPRRKRTIVVDHDFETFCEIDVRQVGAYKYAQHPSCDVLCLSWGTDPKHIRTWCPHKEPELPADLLALCNDPDVLFQAHNAQFEHCIWRYVMTRRYGAPKLGAHRFTCTAARAAACGLPRALDKVGAALNLPIQKDKNGTRLLNKFAKLQAARKPSKKNPKGVPARRIFPQDEPEEFAELVKYNRTDVLAEMSIVEYTPPLPKQEQEYWVLDLQMNTRGIPLDMAAVTTAMPVLTELEQRVVRRVVKLTGGIRPTQRDKMLAFLNGLGLDLENLQAKTLKDLLLLRKEKLTDQQIQLLQLRVEGGKASTKKLKKMLQVVCDDGRVRGAFLYGGAHTLRWAGKLIQPQNFTRGEYKPWQLELLFALIMLGDADVLEILYEWPIDAIAQGMRGFIKSLKKLVVCDFSAIEARILAWLANETEMLKVYHANGDVYIRMATKLYHIAEEVLLDLCKVKFDPKALLQRKFAKDIVLGCLAPNTLVVTPNGLKPIVDILPTDKVWDGVEWVGTQGPAYMGHKEVIDLCGVTLTPDHKVLVGRQWYRADALAANTLLRQSALAMARLQYWPTKSASAGALDGTAASAIVGRLPSREFQTSTTARVQRVMDALSAMRPRPGWPELLCCVECLDLICSSAAKAQRTPGGALYAGVNIPAAAGISSNCDATTLSNAGTASAGGRALLAVTPSTPICTFDFATCTSDAAYLEDMRTNKVSGFASGGWISDASSPTASISRGISLGLTNWNSIGSTEPATTDPATVDSSPSKSTSRTSDVYDLIECGPRNRFTILTDEGPLIVHNCGYQMGGLGFFNNCIKRGILVELEECKKAVKVYRESNPETVKFWYDTERCAIQAVKQRRTKDNPITLRHLTFYLETVKTHTWLCIGLPSGRPIRYNQPEVRKVERFGRMQDQLSYRTEIIGRWLRETTYGGKLVENITQAVSRDIMAESMQRADQRGYHCVGTVHDELIAEVAVEFGSKEELEEIMRIRPKWASDAPINCEGWEGQRYRK